MDSFLAVSKKDMRRRGWDRPDFVLVTGDAYVDHHSFGAAVIGRVLEEAGYKVAVLAQPYWKDERDMDRLGRPRLGFLVTAGNMDSMVAHYSVNRKRRKTDAYSPGGRPGHRPDRALAVYAGLIRKRFGDIPIVAGGLEASLRRFAHYDYWSNSVRASELEESGVDLAVYGMGERTIREVAEALNLGFHPRDLAWIPGVCRLLDELPPALQDELEAGRALDLPSFDAVRTDTRAFNRAFALQYREQDPFRGRTLVQRQRQRVLVQNPPARPLSREELDRVHALPFLRRAHPGYEGQGGVPAIQEVAFSITANRGCFGGCSFCAIAFHQGRIVQSRSKDSILREARDMIRDPGFKGYIHDVGGPTANFYGPACDRQAERGSCADRACLFPEPCPNLRVDHSEYLDVLRALRALPGVKKVFVRSGIRYDYLMADPDRSVLATLCRHHVSGRLKVAPEHVSDRVLRLMGKPPQAVYDAFQKRFRKVNDKAGSAQYLVPYLISGHPGSRLDDAIELALYLKRHAIRPEQVQDFYPVPGTLSTAMYHSGCHPLTEEAVYVPRDKAEQRALLQSHLKSNWPAVRRALHRAGREDLIGWGPQALVPPPGRKPKRKPRRATRH